MLSIQGDSSPGQALPEIYRVLPTISGSDCFVLHSFRVTVIKSFGHPADL